MKSFKKWMYGAALLLAVTWGTLNQVDAQSFINRITGPGVLDFGGAAKVNNDGELNTYSATATGLAPASAATDVACLTGSPTKTIRVTKVTVGGTAATLQTIPVLIKKNAAVDTGGSVGTGAAVLTPYAHLSSQTGATASATTYSGTNPTVTDTNPGVIWGQVLTLPTTAAGTVTVPFMATWGGRGGARAPVLRGVQQQLCVNLAATTVSSGSLTISFEWTEE